MKKYSSYQKYLEQRLCEIQDNQLFGRRPEDSSGYSFKQEILQKWINITRFLEELSESATATTTSPNQKRGIWDYVNAFQEMLERIFEEDFSGSGFFVNERSDLENFDPSALGIALFYHRLLLQDPETGRFYYNVLTLPRIVYISVRKGWDSLTEDAMNWSIHSDISSCASILMINIHTGVSDNGQNSSTQNGSSSSNSSKQQYGNYPSLNSSDQKVPYVKSDKRLNTYHIDVKENASAAEIVEIFQKIVDPMVRQFNPIMAVFNHDFSIHQKQQHQIPVEQQQSQKLSPQEFASILQSIGVSCNHKVLVVANLKLTAQEIQENSVQFTQSNELWSQIPQEERQSQKRNKNNSKVHSQKCDRSIEEEEEEILPSNSVETPKKKGRKQQIPKESKKQTVTNKKQTVTKKLKNNMDCQVNRDDQMLYFPQPEEIVVTLKAKQLIFDILQIQESQANLYKGILSNFNEKNVESTVEIQAQLEAKHQAQISKISTQLQELQVGASIDSLICRYPSGIHSGTTPFQLIQITNPKTIQTGLFLRKVLCVNSQSTLYPGLLFLMDYQFSFEQAAQKIVIDHKYIASMIVAAGYALTEEVNVSFSYLKQQNKLTKLGELERSNIGQIVDELFKGAEKEEKKEKSSQEGWKSDSKDKNGICYEQQQASNIVEIRQDIEEVTEEKNPCHNYTNNNNNVQEKKSINDSITLAIEAINDKIKLKELKMKYACNIKQSKYIFSSEPESNLNDLLHQTESMKTPRVVREVPGDHYKTQDFNSMCVLQSNPIYKRENSSSLEQQQLAIKEKAKLIVLKKLQQTNPLSCSVFDLRRNRRVYLRDASNGQLVFFNQDNQLLVIYNNTSNSNSSSSEETIENSWDSQTESLTCEQQNQQYLLEIYIFNVQVQGQRVHLILKEIPSSSHNKNTTDGSDDQILFSVRRIIPTCEFHFGSSITYDDENVYKILGKSFSSHSTLPIIEIINRKTQIISQIAASGKLMPTAVQGFSSAVVFSPSSSKKYITIYGGYGIDNNPVTQTALLELNLLDFRCCEILNKKDFFEYQLQQSRNAQQESKKECGNQILNGRTTPVPTKSMWSTLPLVFPNSTSHYDKHSDTLYVFGGISNWEEYVCLVKITKVMETSSMRHVQFTKYELDQSLELDPAFPIPQKLLFKPIFFNFMQSLGSVEREPDCVEPLNFKFTQNNTFYLAPENVPSYGANNLKNTIIRFGSSFAAQKQEIQQIFSVEFKYDPENRRDSLPIIHIHMRSVA